MILGGAAQRRRMCTHQLCARARGVHVVRMGTLGMGLIHHLVRRDSLPMAAVIACRVYMYVLPMQSSLMRLARAGFGACVPKRKSGHSDAMGGAACLASCAQPGASRGPAEPSRGPAGGQPGASRGPARGQPRLAGAVSAVSIR